MYTRLNHVGVCASYSKTLRLNETCSEFHACPVEKWITDGCCFKFWGDNIDKKQSVRDERSDRRSWMIHMYSILAGRSRLSKTQLSKSGSVCPLVDVPNASFLPTNDDIAAIRRNLRVIVCRNLTKYFEELTPFANAVPEIVPHRYMEEMSRKSDVAIMDVLMKNEAKSGDMLDIMSALMSYLPSNFGDVVASGGDQLTCERQRASRRHVMDGDTPRQRLEYLKPQIEDWHCLVTFLKVRKA